MKKLWFVLMFGLVFVLAGCQGSASGPAASSFTYDYEIVTTGTVCAPDRETWNLIMEFRFGELEAAQAEAAAQKAEEILACIQTQLESHLNGRGAEGWKLIQIEAFAPSDLDLGFEYTYRMLWEKGE